MKKPLSRRKTESNLTINLSLLPDMYVAEALSDYRIGQELNVEVRAQVTHRGHRYLEAEIEEVIPEGFGWAAVNPCDFDYSSKSHKYSNLSSSIPARIIGLQLVPPDSDEEPPRFRFTLRMSVVEFHYIDRGLVGGSRNGYRATAWNNTRVNQLCSLLEISLFELGNQFLIPKRDMRRYYRQNSWPSTVCLHFHRCEKQAKEMVKNGENPTFVTDYLY